MLFSPALAGPKANLAGMAKFEKLGRMLPDDGRSRAARLGPAMYVLTEKLTPKEKQALIKATELRKPEVDEWQKLEARSKKLETALRAPRIRKASQVYHIVSEAAPDEILLLLYHSTFKQVQERLRNHYQKFLPAVQEITPEEWATVEGTPGTPKYNKAREDFIAARLDRKVPKPAEGEAAPADGEAAPGPGAPPDAPAPAPPNPWTTPQAVAARRMR